MVARLTILLAIHFQSVNFSNFGCVDGVILLVGRCLGSILLLLLLLLEEQLPLLSFIYWGIAQPGMVYALLCG